MCKCMFAVKRKVDFLFVNTHSLHNCTFSLNNEELYTCVRTCCTGCLPKACTVTTLFYPHGRDKVESRYA